MTESGNSLLNGDINNGYKMMELFINPFQETDNNQVNDFLAHIIEQVVVESENDESIDEELLSINLTGSVENKSLLNDWCNKNEKVSLLIFIFHFIYSLQIKRFTSN